MGVDDQSRFGQRARKARRNGKMGGTGMDHLTGGGDGVGIWLSVGKSFAQPGTNLL
jgi:hypothetical protein